LAKNTETNVVNIRLNFSTKVIFSFSPTACPKVTGIRFAATIDKVAAEMQHCKLRRNRGRRCGHDAASRFDLKTGLAFAGENNKIAAQADKRLPWSSNAQHCRHYLRAPR